MLRVMTQEEFEALVATVLDEIPSPFAEALRNVVVTVELHAPPGHGRLYGQYHGVPMTAPGQAGVPALPPRITIFMQPMMWDHPDPADLATQVRVTVLHEVGHHLGMDEDQLERLGYG